MIKIEKTRNAFVINSITKENEKYLEGYFDFSHLIELDKLYFYIVSVNNVVKGYYMLIDLGDNIFDCHLCVRKVTPNLNLVLAQSVLQWFIDYKKAVKFVTYTTDKNKKAKEFAYKLGFIQTSNNNFELRIK